MSTLLFRNHDLKTFENLCLPSGGHVDSRACTLAEYVVHPCNDRISRVLRTRSKVLC
jgi:hypothetical protein